MSTKTEEALKAQSELLNKFSAIIRDLLKYISTLKEDLQQTKEAATAKIAELLGVDSSTANAILANNPDLQSLLDEAAAALPAIQETTVTDDS